MILKEQAQSDSTDTREIAIKSLYAQKQENEITDQTTKAVNEKIDMETLDVIANNINKYDELSETEIDLLGKIPSDKAVDILFTLFPENTDVDDNIISSLGEHLGRKDVSDEPESSPTKNRLTRKKQKEIEKKLLEYLKGSYTERSKQLVLIELYKYYYPDSDKEFKNIYNDDSYGEDVKIAILKILSKSSGSEKKEILNALKKEYLSQPVKYREDIIIARIKILEPDEYLHILKELDEILEKRAKLKQFKTLAGKKQIIFLKDFLKKYKIDPSVVDKIHKETIKVSQDSSKPMDAETSIVYSAMESLYPGKNFFEIREIAKKGMNIRGLFYSIMRAIDRDFEKYDMKILTIQSVWKIDAVNAEKIFTAYRSEKEFLGEIFK
jgi:hypothetical protein